MGNLSLDRRNSITHHDELCQRRGQETDISRRQTILPQMLE